MDKLLLIFIPYWTKVNIKKKNLTKLEVSFGLQNAFDQLKFSLSKFCWVFF